MTKTVAIGYNTSHYVWLFRRNLIRALLEEGFDVVILAPEDDYTARLVDMGVSHIDLPMRMNKNPVSDYLLYRRFVDAMRQADPDVYLGYTIKPNIYGSLAAHRLGIPTINNIAGLGTVFLSDNLVTWIVKTLYRAALKRAAMVFFQNPDDCRLFTTNGVIRHDRYDLLPGSGVDLSKFAFSPLPEEAGTAPLRFLQIGRLLWDKGVGEFVEAAQKIHVAHPDVRFCLLGGLDIDNPAAIPRRQIEDWVREGHVEYIGYSDNVVQEIAASDCIVLPSAYPEGTPRTLLEGAAVGRPIITTDAPGCRETVDDGETGYLCRLRDAADLQEKIERMIALSPQARSAMGRAGRAKMEREYDEAIVIGKYVKKIRDLCPAMPSQARRRLEHC
jgi:glycosyltransferase involved in cell wall biosynthesis